MKFRICVYAICKNESRFVDRFVESAKDADCIVVADTGSTDDTIEKLKKHGVIVGNIAVSPWRFDKARNESLELVPKDIDICVCMDLDEILIKGWRQHIVKAWRPGVTRFRYKFTWSFKADGAPDVVFNSEKIHHRYGYEWRHPVHEILKYVGVKAEVFGWCGVEIEHYPDSTKSRSNYLPLLELSVKEAPEDDRNSHYLGREYYYVGKHEEAIKELKRHLSLPRACWNAERAASMRYIAESYNRLKNQPERIMWLLRAVAEASDHREPWVDLAQAYFDNKNYAGGYFAAKQALNITTRQLSYVTNSQAWGESPHDLASVCAYYVGLYEEARKHALDAWDITPNNPRIICNTKFFMRPAKNVPTINPKIFLLWPTIRPTEFKEAYKIWLSRAKEPCRIHLKVAVNTDEQKAQIDYPVVVVGNDRPGVTYAAHQLTKNLDGIPGDVVVLASDDIVPPVNWDQWLIEQFHAGDFWGCIAVNDGHNTADVVTVPIMDFVCLRLLNKIIYHPAYHHLYSDNELFDNVRELGLLRDLRKSEVIFEHKHWHCNKRPKDVVDEWIYARNKEDYDTYLKRKSLPLNERLKI